MISLNPNHISLFAKNSDVAVPLPSANVEHYVYLPIVSNGTGLLYDTSFVPNPNDFVTVTRWDHSNITYFFQNNTNDILNGAGHQAVRDAFTVWSQNSSLAFVEANNAAGADIVVRWAEGDHQDGNAFDGINGVLAHAYYPPPSGGTLAGDIHFDDAETLTLSVRNDSSQPIDLTTVAIHEIGHSLGLQHSNVTGAIMARYYIGTQRTLSQDDIEGIRFLYPSAQLAGPLSATSWGYGRIDAFGIDNNNHVVQLYFDGVWRWADLGAVPSNVGGGRFATNVLASASWGEGRVDVFGIGQNGHLIQHWFDDGTWHWTDLGAVPADVGDGNFAGPVTAASWGEGRVDVFGIGQNGHLIQHWFDDGTWHWTDLGAVPADVGGGGFAGPVTAASWGEGRVDVFGIGQNGHVIQHWFDGGWHWTDLGLASVP